MKLRIIFVFFLFWFSFSSCAYYNTFYNTKKLFKEANKEREKRQGDKPTSREIQKYDKTIEKASKILEVFPDSKYVDDAVMILGESFYYKGDYIKAQRKFQELITYFPKSKYFQQANLWLAKTNMKLNDYIGAELILKKLEDRPKTKKNILLESRLIWGDLLFEQGNYEAAEGKYKSVATSSKNKEYRAHAYFQLGQSQLQTGKYTEAIDSFKKAMKNSPDEKFKFDAELNYGIALKLAGDFNNAITVCKGLLENTLFKEKRGLIKLEIADSKYRAGRAMFEQLKDADLEYRGKIYEAIDEYEKITLEHKRTEASANAFFQMGRIYEEEFGDFVKAKENYEKVRIEYNRSPLIKEANKKAKDLGQLIKLMNSIQTGSGNSSNGNKKATNQMTEMEMLLLEQGVHPELRFLRKKRKLAQLNQASQATSESPSAQSLNEAPQANVDEIVNNKLQLAEIYLFQLVRIDSALKEYHEILELYPDHPDGVKALYSLAYIYENEFQNKAVTDSLLSEVIRRFPKSYQAQEARKKLGLRPIEMKVDRAAALFKYAEHTLFNKRDFQKAINEYQEIIENYPDSDYAPKALYALGWIYEQKIFENEKALEYYQQVVDKYPDTEISKKLKKKIKAVEIAIKEAEKADSSLTKSEISEKEFAASDQDSTKQSFEDEQQETTVQDDLEDSKIFLQ
jgi:TolA-binding protein